MKQFTKSRGEGYIDMVVLVLGAMLVLAVIVQVLPVFIAKQQLDTFATELVREAEIVGEIGAETDHRATELMAQTGLSPDIQWSHSGKIQLNDTVTLTLTYQVEMGLFGPFGSFPIELQAQAMGKSEVYWR